jgi:hypothetical protein
METAGTELPVPDFLHDHAVKCTTCGALIVKPIHAITGRRGAVDAAPSTTGNLIVNDGSPITYVVATRAERALLAGHLHMSHFATCPDAAQHRITTAKGNTK